MGVAVFVCVRCYGTDRHPQTAVARDGVNTVCLEHLVDAWRDDQLCRACRYYLASADGLCEECRVGDERRRG